jgi:hypothetical protein
MVAAVRTPYQMAVGKAGAGDDHGGDEEPGGEREHGSPPGRGHQPVRRPGRMDPASAVTTRGPAAARRHETRLAAGVWPLVRQDALGTVWPASNARPAISASVTATSRACSEGLEPGLAVSMNRP